MSLRSIDTSPAIASVSKAAAIPHPPHDRAQILDVLRGLAVIAVILLHSGGSGSNRGLSWYDDFVWPVLSHGYLGVQLFFVISGYCIQGAVESARRARSPWRTFFKRRVRRIYPPYWWSLIVSILLAIGTIAFMGKTWGSIFPLSIRDWLLNVLLMQGPFHAPDVGEVYWSLTIEVQFYILMSIGLLVGRWSAAWLMGLSGLYLAWRIQPSVLISGTALAYWPEFACGIASYYAVHHETRGKWFAGGVWGLTVLSAIVGLTQGPSVLAADGELTTPYKQLFCLACGLVLWCLVQCQGSHTSRSGTNWLARIGVMSYSLYLIHVPIGTRFFNLSERLISMTGPAWIAVFLVSLSIQFLAGYLFYRWCEAPWLNRRTIADEQPAISPVMATPLTFQKDVVL